MTVPHSPALAQPASDHSATLGTSSARGASAAANWARVVEATESPGPVWRPDDLAAIWLHQLAAPLHFENYPAIDSCAVLFQHPCPPVECLRQVKDFAKANWGHAESLIPTDVARALYLLSIALAETRLHVAISRLPRAEILAGFDWMLAQPWLGGQTLALVRTARDIMKRERCPNLGCESKP